MITIKADWLESQQYLAKLQKIFDKPEDYRVFTQASIVLDEIWGETFAKQGARSGLQAWAPLNKSYARWKQLNGKPSRIMILTGDLQGSAKILTRYSTELTWGTMKPYAKHHQDPKVEGRPPQRPLISIVRKDINKMSRVMERYIKQLIGA